MEQFVQSQAQLKSKVLWPTYVLAAGEEIFGRLMCDNCDLILKKQLLLSEWIDRADS